MVSRTSSTSSRSTHATHAKTTHKTTHAKTTHAKAKTHGHTAKDTFHKAKAKSPHAHAKAKTTRTAAIGTTAARRNALVRQMAAAAKRAGVPAELPIMTALVESRFRNLNYGDRDSVGMFQQRNAWGSRAARMNPSRATEMFLHGGAAGQRGAVDFKGRFANQPHNAQTLGRWAQAVQVSAFPTRYANEYKNARAMLHAAGVAGY